MNEEHLPSPQKIPHRVTSIEVDINRPGGHRHHHRSHHHHQSSRPHHVASGAEMLTRNIHVQATGPTIVSGLYQQQQPSNVTFLDQGQILPPHMMTRPTFELQVDVQSRLPRSILKARAIMTSDDILAAGVASKQNFTGDPAIDAKQPIYGVINFEQTSRGVHITGRIDGLGQGTSHGFHIHEFGDVSSGCSTTGAHFNPFRRNHGGLNDVERHLGDFGNVTADANGVVHVNILDPMISLYGEYSIVGRAIVIHAMPDDLGRGGNKESLKTGNSGARLACGIIGFTKP
ncbi:unnamed protein product [Rotaria sordida]|uniref:Superoxide dismutase [Cu-Zn] n=1 Tax=Rotaria sordida TaxID=392033 RepID=A0A815GW21_9BILA|nr:unnamed protein product [Rotaria sordida]CAF3678556.1 unnamed protein product [Rotaria sordida]